MVRYEVVLFRYIQLYSFVFGLRLGVPDSFVRSLPEIGLISNRKESRIAIEKIGRARLFQRISNSIARVE